MTTAIIVQARVGSTRLRGKVLMDIGGRLVLDEVLRRCRAIPGADVVVCAIPDQVEDEVLAPVAERAGAVVARGSSSDVLSRYLMGADAVGADIVMRVTSDCPLIDPGVCGAVLRRRAETGADYACNNMPASFPHGLDCEAMTTDALRRAARFARDDLDLEHVTQWLRDAADVRRSTVEGPGGAALRHRWTLDYPEDYAFMRAVFAELPPPPAIPPWTDVAALLDARPDIVALNAARHVVHG